MGSAEAMAEAEAIGVRLLGPLKLPAVGRGKRAWAIGVSGVLLRCCPNTISCRGTR